MGQVNGIKYFKFEVKRSITSLPGIIYYAFLAITVVLYVYNNKPVTSIYNYISSFQIIFFCILPPIIIFTYFLNNDFFKGIDYNLSYHFGLKINKLIFIKFLSYIVTFLLPYILLYSFEIFYSSSLLLKYSIIFYLSLLIIILVFISIVSLILISTLIGVFLKQNIIFLSILFSLIFYLLVPMVISPFILNSSNFTYIECYAANYPGCSVSPINVFNTLNLSQLIFLLVSSLISPYNTIFYGLYYVGAFCVKNAAYYLKLISLWLNSIDAFFIFFSIIFTINLFILSYYILEKLEAIKR